MRPTATVAAFALAAQFAYLPGAAGATVQGRGAPTAAQDKSVPVAPVVSHYTKPALTPSWHAPKISWPSGSATVALTGQAAPSTPRSNTQPANKNSQAAPAASAPKQAGSLPVWVGTPTGAGAVSSAMVTVEPQSAASAAGVNGVLLTLARADHSTASGSVQVKLSYAQFKDAFGGDWGARLTLVELPACSVTTPNVPACRVQTPVQFANNGADHTLSAQIGLPAAPVSQHSAMDRSAAVSPTLVLAATADSSSDAGSGGGDYTATTLKSSGSWQAGGSADAFAWSYPISAPAVPGGLAPTLGLSYDSQGVDGLTSASNNQAGTIGDGWGMSESYIERSYQSCHQNPSGPTQTYDNCWSANNALTLDLNGQTSTLIKDDTSGDYHPETDTHERVEYKTGAANGAQNGEYWVVTTTDGTQYYFGQDELPGWSSGNAKTNAVDTEPVYSTASGQPCYNATFSSSDCEQAYRWNLDYVVDPHGDAMSYWYNTTTAYYAQDKGATAPSTSAYTRDSYLSKIQYGQRAGAVYSSTPAGEVDFTANGRCSTSPTGCDTSTLSSTTAKDWPDVPWDQNCASGAKCSTQSPTFWSENEITGIQTKALVGSTLTPVDSWALTYSFPAITGAGDTSTPSLWLNSITQTGHDTSAGGSTSSITLPTVSFSGTALQNRTNLGDGYPWITRQRLTKITTETGETVTVNYSAPACGSSTPGDDSHNSMLCYPVYWYPTGDANPVKEYFNKYVVDSVTQQDATGGSGNDTIVTSYTPVGNPAWHYDDSLLVPANQRTWDRWRGYSGMVVSTGTAPDPSTKTQYTYFQGMNGDYLSSTSTRSASIGDTRGDSVTDSDQFAGQTYETQIFNGGALVKDTVDTPWSSAATATHALSAGIPAQQAFTTAVGSERVYIPLANGSTRETETDYTRDSSGRITQSDDLGDLSTSADDQCTTTTYADNTGGWILNKPAEIKTVSVKCSTTPSLPANAVSDKINFYDGSTTVGAAPTAGNVTMVQQAASYTGSTPNYATISQTTFDEYGRDTAYTDADNHTSKTAYTPATGAEPTSIGVTDAMNMVTTTAYDSLRELPTTATTPAGYVTTEQYDALGRLTAVYKPGEGVSTGLPNSKFSYAVSDTAASAVDTYTLNDDGTYRVSETLYDSMLRAREVQTGTVDGGRDITDTYYDTDGWTSETTDPYYNASAVSAKFVQAQVGDIPSATGFSYDGDGRKTTEIAYANGTQMWQTTYTYGGNFVTTVPPAGKTAETVVTNAQGKQTDLVQYLAGKPTDYVNDPASDYTDTQFTYYPDGDQASETDAAGDEWSWQYNLLGYKTQTVDPDAGTSTSTYDNTGKQLTSTDARGKQITYTYDADGRKTAQYDTSSTQTLSSANELASWAYDSVKLGLPTSSTSYSNGDTYTDAVLSYDSIAKPETTKITLTGTDAALVPSSGYITTYGYTLAGNVATQNDPAEAGLPSEALHYTYDEYGQPVSLASTGGATWSYVSAVGYDEYGKAVKYTMPTAGGNVWAVMSYDPQTQALTGVQTTDSTSTPVVDSLQYTYGNASGSVSKGSGLLTATVDSQGYGSTVDTQCYTYDYADRLAQAWTATDNCAATPSPGNSASVGGTDAPYWQSWTYNAAGDRLSQVDHDVAGNTANDTTTGYNYPAVGSAQSDTVTNSTSAGPNASQNTTSYSYDPSGNTTSIAGGALGNQTLTWDSQDKLQSDTTSAGATGYVYDTSGNQIVVRDPGTTTFYAGDAQLSVATASGALSGVRYYTFGGVTIAERTSAGVVSDLIPDRQGTDVLAVSTAAAQTVTRRQYLPFGAARGSGAAAWVGGTKGYVGGNADATTGLENLGARQYDTASGRFLSADSLYESEDPTQMGGYDYAGNDPVTTSDPSGKMALGIPGFDLTAVIFDWASMFVQLFEDAEFARDELFTRPGIGIGNGRVFSAAAHPQSGEVAAGHSGSANGMCGPCAEDSARANLSALLTQKGIPFNPDDFLYTAAYGTRDDGTGQLTYQQIPICARNCQVKLDDDQVPNGTRFEVPGRWQKPGGGTPSGGGGGGGAAAAADGAGDSASLLSRASSMYGRANGIVGDLLDTPVAKVGGGALLVASIGLDIYDVATAPPAQRAHVAIHAAGQLVGGIAGAAVGTAIGGPIGGIIGGAVGSWVGGGVADAAESAWNKVSSWF